MRVDPVGGSILPDSTPMECQIGATFAQEFLYWDDLAGNTPHSFTGWTVSCTVEHQNGQVTTVPAALSTNSVLISLKADVTSTFHEETAKYLIKMTSNSDPTDIYYLGAGPFEITDAL